MQAITMAEKTKTRYISVGISVDIDSVDNTKYIHTCAHLNETPEVEPGDIGRLVGGLVDRDADDGHGHDDDGDGENATEEEFLAERDTRIP